MLLIKSFFFVFTVTTPVKRFVLMCTIDLHLAQVRLHRECFVDLWV